MRRTSVVLAAGLLLSGCTSTIEGSPTPTPPPKPVGSAVAMVLSRVPAASLGPDGYFDFGDSARLRQLGSTDAAIWKNQVTSGAAGLFGDESFTVATIGVDLSTAGSALTVGQPPQSMIVLVGGQDQSKITAAATKSGWTGEAVLSRDSDVSKGSAAAVGIILAAPKIRPIGADVVLSQPDGDPASVAGAGTAAPSAADQLPGVKAAISCLGDVPTASATDVSSADPSAWTAVGAGAGTATTASSVICLGAATAATADALAGTVRSALATGRSKRSRQPWKQLLRSAKVDVLPGSPTMVRISASTATAALGLQLVTARDLPGR